MTDTLSGAVLFTIAGALWAGYGAWSLKSLGEPLLGISVVLIAVTLLTAISVLQRDVRQWPPSADKTDVRRKWVSRMFRRINIAQGVLIFVGLQVCVNLKHPEYFPPLFVSIVGLHFIALAPVYRTYSHGVTGVLLVLLAVATMTLVPQHLGRAGDAIGQPLWPPILGFGSAAILWASAAFRVVRSRMLLIRLAPMREMPRPNSA